MRLLSVDSIAEVILQYIAIGIGDGQDAGGLVSTISDICQVLVDSELEPHISDDSLESLVDILDGHDTTILVTFSSASCMGSLRLLQRAIEMSSGSAIHLAMKFMASFCLELETSQITASLDQKAKEHCLGKMALLLETIPAPGRLIFSNLQRLIEAKSGIEAISSEHQVYGVEDAAAEWTDKESLTHFRHLLSTTPASKRALIRESLPANAISPETVNLVYFLVDSYSDWQSKMDAVHFILRACISEERSIQHLLYELLYSMASACAIVAGTPISLGGNERYTSTWRSALCGLLPRIIASLNFNSSTEAIALSISDLDLAGIINKLLSEPSNALTGCEVMLVSAEDKKKQNAKRGGVGMESEVDMMLDAFIGTDEGPSRQPIRAALIRSLQNNKLLSQQSISSLSGNDAIRNDMRDLAASYSEEINEGQRANEGDLVSLFEQKLLLEMQEESDLLQRITEDYACQYAFAAALAKVITDCINSGELDNLARLCRLLSNDVTTLDICLLYISPEQLLHPISGLVEEDGNDLLQNGEEPSVLGAILLFAQVIIQKALSANRTADKLLPPDKYRFMNTWIQSASSAYGLASLSASDQGIISSWITALFDSDGISDDLIKSSSPSTMLRLTPSLFLQSIHACCQGVIDMDTLRGGLTYFLQDLLSYTLPCAINWLLFDLSRCQQEDANSPFQDESSKMTRKRDRDVRLEVLSMLLISESCPPIVQKLVANGVLEVLKAYQSSSEVAEKAVVMMKAHADPTRTAKTHLWIKISQAQMKSCNVDALLSLDVSFDVLRCTRGQASALHVVKSTLTSSPKSPSLCRAVAASLCFAHLQDDPESALVEDVVVAFTYAIFEPKCAVHSIIATLDIILQMVKLSANVSAQRSVDAVEALIALRIRQMLKRSASKADVARIFSQFGCLFDHLSEESPMRGILMQ